MFITVRHKSSRSSPRSRDGTPVVPDTGPTLDSACGTLDLACMACSSLEIEYVRLEQLHRGESRQYLLAEHTLQLVVGDDFCRQILAAAAIHPTLERRSSSSSSSPPLLRPPPHFLAFSSPALSRAAHCPSESCRCAPSERPQTDARRTYCSTCRSGPAT